MHESSLIDTDDERAQETKTILRAEAEELGKLAHDAEYEAPEYNIKRMNESYSRKTRSREFRNVHPDLLTDSEELH